MATKKSKKSSTSSEEGRQEREPTKEHKYLIELSRNNASTILMSKTRIIDVKKTILETNTQTVKIK